MRILTFIVVAITVNAIAAAFSDTYFCGWFFGWFMAMAYDRVFAPAVLLQERS